MVIETSVQNSRSVFVGEGKLIGWGTLMRLVAKVSFLAASAP